MRNPVLRGALYAFAEDAAMALHGEMSAGVELPFELVEAGAPKRGGVPLYCYRPLTREFLAQQGSCLRALGSYAPALRAFEQQSGLESYLGEGGRRTRASRPRDRAHQGLSVFLERLFEGRTEFTLERERFELVYQELERLLYEDSCHILVVAPVFGLDLDRGTTELPLGEGLALLRAEAMADAPPESVWGDDERPYLLVALSLEDDRNRTPAVVQARARFRELLSVLRLYEKGTFALGALAWTRRDDGVWRSVVLGGTGCATAPPRLLAEQEDELRAFANLVARRRPSAGEVAWALQRYEMGRERAIPAEALSDYLLALRALLEPEGPSSGRLAQRLSTICAVPAERARLARRVIRAVELEKAIISGSVAPGPANLEIIEELGEYLRAILRDVLCGHLEEDLVRVADDLLAASAQPQPEPAFVRPRLERAARPRPDPVSALTTDHSSGGEVRA